MRWKKASRFIFGDGIDEEYGLSFEEVCSLFSWEPGYLRRLTKKLNRSDIKDRKSVV